jgi:hypothetical protein
MARLQSRSAMTIGEPGEGEEATGAVTKDPDALMKGFLEMIADDA